jgi:hypothetical protein
MEVELHTTSTALAFDLRDTQPSGVEVTLDPTLGMRTANTSDGTWTCIQIFASVLTSVLATWLATRLFKHRAKGTTINRKELHFDSEGQLRRAIEEQITTKSDQ